MGVLWHYPNNLAELDHRFVRQQVRATLGLKTFHTARATLSGIELVYMMRNGQLRPLAGSSDADQFCPLGA